MLNCHCAGTPAVVHQTVFTFEEICEMPPIDPERLKLAMRLAGVSSAELARRLDVSEAYISQLRNGVRRGSRDRAGRERLAAALGVPTDWIEEEQR